MLPVLPQPVLGVAEPLRGDLPTLNATLIECMVLLQSDRYLSGRCWGPLGSTRPSTRSSGRSGALPLLGEFQVLHVRMRGVAVRDGINTQGRPFPLAPLMISGGQPISMRPHVAC